MYDYSPLGRILIQESTNGSYKLTRHFQIEMHDLFYGFEFIHAYIDDLLILTEGY